MNIMKSKTTAVAIALFLMMAVALVALPMTNARMWPTTIPNWVYVGVAPETVGINEEVIIVFWSNFIPPTAIGAYGDRWTFFVDITTPNGDTETLGGANGFESDPVGGAWTTYTPTEVGTYSIVARMLEHTIDGGASRGMENPAGPVSWPSLPSDRSLGDVFAAAESDPQLLEVVEEPSKYYTETPLPEGYWERPVYGANHDWGQIMGNWLNAGDIKQRTNHYSTGPGSSHILWARPYWDGGIMGGSADVNFGSIGYYSGLSYENFGGVDFILNGRIYFSDEINPRNGFYCVDLYTGETLYFRNNSGAITGVGGPFAGTGEIPYGDPEFGQVLDVENPNQHGGMAYFWDTNPGQSLTWAMYDAYSGQLMCYIENIPSWTQSMGFFMPPSQYESYGLEGSILRWHVENYGNSTHPNMYLQCWNTSQAIHYREVYSANTYWMWRPGMNATYDGNNGYTLNVSIPGGSDTVRYVKEGDYVIVGDPGSNNGTEVVKGHWYCLNLDRTKGAEGSLRWDTEFTPPAGLGDEALQWAQFSQHDIAYDGMDPEIGIFWFDLTMDRQWYVYDIQTGERLWVSEPEEQWQFYGMNSLTYNGKFYSYGNGGVLRCYEPLTGEILWEWSAPFVGVGETAFGKTPLSLGCVADGKLYMYSSEHSPSQPLRRDAKLYAVDAETGEGLWALQCWPQNPVIADGRIVTFDLFDHQLYCIGKGPSATTVVGSPEVSVHGSSVLLKGTVTDESVGAPGTPAISDESMDAWMEYLYHQRPIPADAKGVNVTLDTIDPNGNFVPIGTATTDITGNYALAFTPAVPGTYQIIATFAGSESYGSSFAQTYLHVDDAPEATPPPTPTPAPMTDTYILGSTVGIIIAIVVVGLLIVLLMRRR